MMQVKISAKDVKKLRDRTGAGMMDCKNALKAAEGDFDAAIEFLRKKGQKLSLKRADRATTEGVAIARTSADGTQGIVFNLGCETDFVAKNADFVAFAQKIADIAIANMPATLADLLATAFDAELTIGEKVIEQVGVIGEKLEISTYETLTATQVVPYIHAGYRIGVLVGLTVAGDDYVAAGKNVAMQVAAMRPVGVDKDDVDASVVQKEIEIGKEVARNAGRPEHLLERIAQGKLGKFFKENTLLNQAYVKDNSMDVRGYLKSLNKDLTVTAFKRVAIGAN